MARHARPELDDPELHPIDHGPLGPDLLTEATRTAPEHDPGPVHRYRWSRAWLFAPLIVVVAVIRFAPAGEPETPAQALMRGYDPGRVVGYTPAVPVTTRPVQCLVGLDVATARRVLASSLPAPAPALYTGSASDAAIVSEQTPACGAPIARPGGSVVVTASEPVTPAPETTAPETTAPPAESAGGGSVGVSGGGGRDRDHVRVCIGHGIVRVCS